MDTIATLGVILGSSFTSGINLYATVGFLGLFGRLHWLNLPENLAVLTHPAVIAIALFLYLVEFIADKIPAVDTFWDAVHTFIRVPAGAVLAFAAVGGVSPELKLGAALLGGGLAFATHATKTGLRATANLSPEPFSNWMLSLGEDAAVLASLWLMLEHPWAMIAIVLIFLCLFIWFVPKIFRGFRYILRKLFRRNPETLPSPRGLR